MLESIDSNKKNNYSSPIIGGGEMGKLIRNYDWAKTPLGTISGWPHILCTTIGIIINSKLPMLLSWGKEYNCFYNDAYNEILRNNGSQSASPGKSVKEVHPETWPVMFPIFEKVLLEDEVDENVGNLIINYGDGKNEEITLSYNCSPLIAESGKTAGVFVTCL